MESTNQDDDSPFESKNEDNGKLLHMDSLSKQPTAESTEAELHRSILSKIAHNIYAKKFKASQQQHQQESSANVDFKCEDDEDQRTVGLSSAGVGGPFVEQLKSIADTGIVDIDWPTLQQTLRNRLDEVLEQYLERNPDCKDEQYQEPNVGKFNLENSKEEILELIASFNEAPFTIQRICELLYLPFKYYDKTSTFLRGMEKNLRVISSNDWPKITTNDSVATSSSSSAAAAAVVGVATTNTDAIVAKPQDIIENNCTSIEEADPEPAAAAHHHQQTSASSSSTSTSSPSASASASSSEHPSTLHQ